MSSQMPIAPDGQVTPAVVVASSIDRPQMEPCFAKLACSWTFRKNKAHGVDRVTYPFVFAAT